MSKMPTKLRKSIAVELTPAELPRLAADVQTEMRTHFIPGIIRAIPVAYEDCKTYVEKSRTTFEDGRRRTCGVCKKEADLKHSLVVVCPVDSCQSVSHVSCLSRKFLTEESNKDALIPVQGTCVSCQSPINWSTLMKELSLRTHGEEEIKAMFQKKRQKKSGSAAASDMVSTQDPADEQDEDLDETWLEDVNDDEDKLPESNIG